MEFSAAANELYGVDPGQFTETRARLAGELGKDEARRLKALRRPTVSAWAVNLLVRDETVGRLLELGERIREAWSSGGDLSALERQRVTLVTELVQRARTLAEDAGRPLSEAFAREVENTLHAAIADEEAAGALRSGRLERPLSHAGFGTLGAAPMFAPPRKQERPAEKDQKAVAEEAARRAEETSQGLAERESEVAAIRQAMADANERLARLRDEITATQNERANLDHRLRQALKDRDQAARTAELAKRARDKITPAN